MKKVLIVVCVLGLAAQVFALDAITGNRQDRIIEELVENNNELVTNATVDEITVSTAASIAGRYPVLSGQAATNVAVQSGSCTWTAAITYVSFQTPFAAVPAVLVSYTAAAISTNPVYSTGATTNGFNVVGTSNVNWIAIGAK